MSNQSLDELLLADIGQSAALSWIENEIRAAGKYKKRGFNAELASATGFSLSYVGKVLSGKSKATVAFLVAFGKFVGLTEQEVKAKVFNFEIDLAQTYTRIINTEPTATTSTGEIFPATEASDQFKAIGTVSTQFVGVPERLAYAAAGIPYNKIAGVTGKEVLGDAEYRAILKEIQDKIKLYMTCVDTGGVLGWAAYLNFLNMIMLPPHEMIDLVYQFRKLYDGDSDQIATAAADEKIANSGIKKAITRLKLERIPVEPEEENRRNKEKE